MAKTGNHGQVIPRDRAMLSDLYWNNDYGFPQLAKLFGVRQSSVRKVFKSLGIPSRPIGTSRHSKCVECGNPALKLKHKLTKNGYGTRCKDCRRKHYNSLSREYIKLPHVARKRKQYMEHWAFEGPINPQGEQQWITKSKALLRSTRRILRGNPAASTSASAASAPEQTSQT